MTENAKKIFEILGVEPNEIFKVDGYDYKYYIDDNGTIYYNYPEHPDLLVWCPASQLTAHLHYLEQIKAR